MKLSQDICIEFESKLSNIELIPAEGGQRGICMEAWKFVIWGAGERGKLITEFLGESQIAAYIDSDKAKQGKAWLNRPVISFAEYKIKYEECFVIVTPVDEEPILSELESNHIKRYFRMSHLPSKMQ